MNWPKLFSTAREASICSDHDQHKLGCVIFDKRGKVISVGHNLLNKTHPLLRRYDAFKTLHAEASALLFYKHPEHFKGASLLVYRETKNGKLANARPCHMCTKLIKLYGLKRVYYTNDQGIHHYEV